MAFEIVWRRPLHQQGDVTALAVTPDRLLVHERSTRLVCLDAADGTLHWDVPVGTWPRAVVADRDRCLVIPQNFDRLDCLDLQTGAVLWRAELPQFTGHIVPTPETVLAGGWRGYTPLMAFDRETGAMRWRTTQRMNTVLPAVVGDHVLIGEPDGTSVAMIDPQHGDEVSRWELPELLRGGDGQVRAFTRIDTGRYLMSCGQQRLWEIRLPTGTVSEFFRGDTGVATAEVGLAGGIVWLRESHTGHVAIDQTTRRLLWRVDVRQQTIGEAVPVADGFIVAGRWGVLFLVDRAGVIRARGTVDRRIAAVHGIGANRALAVGKGSLVAVAVSIDSG